MEILIFLVVWLAFGVVGAMIMSGKDRTSCGGFALGVLLGPIGLIIALLITPSVQHEAERQMKIDTLKGSSSSSRSRRPGEQPREMPRREPSKQPQQRPAEAHAQMPAAASEEQRTAESQPNVFVRERPMRSLPDRYRWECDSCGEAGEWTTNETSAENQAKAHVCERRIPRRR